MSSKFECIKNELLQIDSAIQFKSKLYGRVFDESSVNISIRYKIQQELFSYVYQCIEIQVHDTMRTQTRIT